MSASRLLASQADRAALAEVLADPEFQAQRWSGDQLRRWLSEWWERLTELLGTAEAGRWAGLGRGVFLGTAVVALLLLWHAVRQRQRQRRATAGAAAPRSGGASLEPPVIGRADVADAQRALAAGDAVEAVRLAFLAAIGSLRRRLRAATVDGLTGSELAGRVADEGFGRLARLHERTVFGRRPVSPEEAAAALAEAARLASGSRAGRDQPPDEVAP
jgi:hypothetical protein